MPFFCERFFRYVPIRRRDMDWGLYVNGAGFTTIAPDEEYPPKEHPSPYYFTWEKGRVLPEFMLSYVTAGHGEFESGPTGTCEMGAGKVMLVFPGVWHRYRPSEETGWEGLWVSFNGEVMDRLVSRGFFSVENAVLTTGLHASILNPFQCLLERLDKGALGFPHLIAADTVEILAAVLAAARPGPARLIDQGPEHVSPVEDRLVAQALQIIWHFKEGRELSVDEVVRQMPVSRRSLERRFRTVLGRTVSQEIVDCHLARAKRLLAETQLPIKEIAALAGFPSADRMGRIFRRVKGISPHEYRAKYQK